MKNLFNKRSVKLGIIYLLFMFTSLIIYFASGNFTYRWIAVNLFLSCLPFVFATLAQKAKQQKNKILHIIFIFIWLAFFPNAPYMITDFIHTSYLGFNSYFVVVRDAFAWFGLVYMTLGIMLGILAGVSSLDIVVRPMFKTKGHSMATITVAVVSIMSGYAIYIGRFLRFNSWDLLTNPINLVQTLVQEFELFTVLFSLLFAACIAFIYLIFYILKGRE